MKKFLPVFLVLIIVVSSFAACSDTSPSQEPEFSPAELPSPGYEDIVLIDTVIEALQNPEDWVVIDVRTIEEFNGESRLPNAYGSGRLKGSVNVDRELVFRSDGELLAYDELMELYGFIGERKVIVLCHGGIRSAFIWGILSELGFRVFNYEGSWIDWSRAASVADGYPNDVVLSLTEAWTDNEGEI